MFRVRPVDKSLWGEFDPKFFNLQHTKNKAALLADAVSRPHGVWDLSRPYNEDPVFTALPPPENPGLKIVDNQTCVEDFIGALETVQEQLELCCTHMDPKLNAASAEAFIDMEKIRASYLEWLINWTNAIEDLREHLGP